MEYEIEFDATPQELAKVLRFLTGKLREKKEAGFLTDLNRPNVTLFTTDPDDAKRFEGVTLGVDDLFTVEVVEDAGG